MGSRCGSRDHGPHGSQNVGRVGMFPARRTFTRRCGGKAGTRACSSLSTSNPAIGVSSSARRTNVAGRLRSLCRLRSWRVPEARGQLNDGYATTTGFGVLARALPLRAAREAPPRGCARGGVARRHDDKSKRRSSAPFVKHDRAYLVANIGYRAFDDATGCAHTTARESIRSLDARRCPRLGSRTRGPCRCGRSSRPGRHRRCSSRFDFPHNVIPDMRAADTATIQFQRQLAVYFAPRFTDAGPQVALQRIDEIGELFRVVPVLPMTSDRQARRLVVFPVGIVATNTLPRRLLALVAVPLSWAFGHDLRHVVTHGIAASRPADQNARSEAWYVQVPPGAARDTAPATILTLLMILSKFTQQ